MASSNRGATRACKGLRLYSTATVKLVCITKLTVTVRCGDDSPSLLLWLAELDQRIYSSGCLQETSQEQKAVLERR